MLPIGQSITWSIHTTNLADLKKHFKLLTDPSGYSSEEQKLLERFLSDKYTLREEKNPAASHVGNQGSAVAL